MSGARSGPGRRLWGGLLPTLLCGWSAFALGAGDTSGAPVLAQNARGAIHVQTPEELEQSYWNRIKDSTDPTDFEEYSRQFPDGAHRAEASVMARRLKKAEPSVQAPAASTARQAPTPTTPAPADDTQRFAVAHKHTFSWCYGYLVVSRDSVRFEVAQPASDQSHGFSAKPPEVTAEQWVVLGSPQAGIELTAGGHTYIFVWLTDPDEVRSGSARRLTPPQGLRPYRMLTALALAKVGSPATVAH